jgi:signal transduction histidine kinase
MTEKHNLNLSFDIEDKKLFLDQKLMRFIFNNLLSNAAKYSPEGGTIDFSISTCNKNLVIKVSDEGIGIPAEEIGKIFDPFYRSKNTEMIEGTGLGLAIVKFAVELHNGEIKVNSEMNKGTTFLVKIPLNNH